MTPSTQYPGSLDYLNSRDALAFSRGGASQSQLISICFAERPTDDAASVLEQVRKRVRVRAPLIPRLMQRIVATPWGVAPPAWFDAELFDIDYHVQSRQVLGGGIPELMHVIESVMGPLDLRRPPWRIYVVEGFDDGKWAFIVQVHHAVGDGAACIALFGAVLLDLDFAVPSEATRSKVFAPPKLRLVAPGLAWRGRGVVHKTKHALRVISSPSRVRAAVHDVRRLTNLLRRESRQPYTPTGINVPATGDWVCRLTTRPLDEVRALARSNPGATVNTVYLSAVARGIETALKTAGMPLQAPLKIGVPKNLRQDTDRVFVDSSTQTGNLVVTAPLGQDDPSEVLTAITDRLRHALDSDEPGIRAMLGKGGAVQKWPLKWNVTATLVHGPPFAPDSLGGRVERWLLTALPGGTKGLGLIAMAYDGILTIFVVADRSLAATADGVCEGMQAYFNDLATAVGHGAEPLMDVV
ncbi:wax ester/triacylglycerol synthase domain-containing protein [Mycobacterium asiaticum]|uniref:wax ester/triacylglycerol synthase domain-containing protein n=1 Tax=Mycobacterium asiaticum TaxID=1790 RepID=UPI001561AB7C|nr:wax ester/triacylglycerol synthase domain-containing protein [Mycobacterium asiaticum]